MPTVDALKANSTTTHQAELVLAPTFCRLKEFLPRSNEEGVKNHFGAQHVTTDTVGWQARQELAEITAKFLPYTLGIGLPLFVTFFDKQDGSGQRHKGALVYNQYDGEPLVYCHNALLGYTGSGPGVSRILLEKLGVSEQQLQLVFDRLSADAKRQRRQGGSYEITVKVS